MTSDEASVLAVAITVLDGNGDLPLPSYQTTHAAAMDLHAAVREPVTIAPGAIALIGCGFAMALPGGYEAQVRPRSGLASKSGVTVVNAPGTIDADYRGEVKVALINLGPTPFLVERGARIAQLVVAPVTQVRWRRADTLEATARGAGGFGHTGT
jgi:dUTP pyrophosphatase